eukprot:CAMPEP_0180102092 /NCGR_PEP_ID=MMETSP0985-20121206/29944_1 /TAXON_ID=483367 /ORGANISM="non described non described, Strain CCMP 2436" /LENGTH=127 /DNA_ID=CAMNT_0022038265 /DNA_START=583 /DNA_END=963 /DNA_ORIENTATION=+
MARAARVVNRTTRCAAGVAERPRKLHWLRREERHVVERHDQPRAHLLLPSVRAELPVVAPAYAEPLAQQERGVAALRSLGQSGAIAATAALSATRTEGTYRPRALGSGLSSRAGVLPRPAASGRVAS